MPINPLPQPTPLKAPPLINVPQIDWSPFNQIGDALVAAGRRKAIANAESEATDADGNLDVAKFGTALASRGLTDEARPLLALAQQKAALDQTTKMNAAQIAHMQAEEGLQRAQLGETVRMHNEEMNKPIAGGEDIWGNKNFIQRGPDGSYHVVQLQSPPDMTGGAPAAASPGTAWPSPDAAKMGTVDSDSAIPGAGAGPYSAVTAQPPQNANASAPQNGGIGGMRGVDYSLTGDAFLGQFSPDIQQAVKNYIAGNSMPTGNPRKGYVQGIKAIAQKYGADLGVPADDNTYAARHKAITALSSSSPGSLGGQMTYARTSLNHLADVAEAAANLNNWNGLGFAPLGWAINYGSELGTDQAAKVRALQDAAGHYGQEVTKYYAGSPGGEGERMQFIKSLGGGRTSAELASTLEAELNLAQGKISKTQATINDALGPNSKYQVMGPAELNDIQRINAALDRLRGKSPTAATPAKPRRVIQGGHIFDLQPDGSYKAVQ